MEISHDLSQLLKSYVYIYRDPIDGTPFYIGKGKGNRVLNHLTEETISPKTDKIKSLQKEGREPVIEILRYGLTDNEASLLESSIIDLIGVVKLTNLVRGSDSKTFGSIYFKELISMHNAPEIEIKHPVILITINKLWLFGISRGWFLF